MIRIPSLVALGRYTKERTGRPVERDVIIQTTGLVANLRSIMGQIGRPVEIPAMILRLNHAAGERFTRVKIGRFAKIFVIIETFLRVVKIQYMRANGILVGIHAMMLRPNHAARIKFVT